RTPVQTAVVSIIVNILLGILLMRPLAHGGLALATSLASIVNLGLLISALSAKLGRLGWRSITHCACRTLACSGIMGVVVWAVAAALIPSDHQSLSGLLLGLMVSIATGLFTYVAISFFIRSPEFISVFTEVKNSIRKR
ncbi:MAG: polysaccharide biosynthesis C-terminal domain-containing protein, partial [Desulfobacterales bacterium]